MSMLNDPPSWLQSYETINWLIEVTNGAVVGASIAVIGTVITAAAALAGVSWTVREANRRANQDRESAENRAREDREGTDLRERETGRHERFSSIIEQLASDRSTVRLGALFSLSALADEWHKEYDAKAQLFHSSQTAVPPDVIAAQNAALGQRQACIEVLCAYLRARPIGSEKIVGADGGELSDYELAMRWSQHPEYMPDREARQAAVAILGQHLSQGALFKWPSSSIRLHGAHLEQVNFFKLDLEGASLWGAHMQGGRLDGAKLAHALLVETGLQGASLVRADLSKAILHGARFHEADLTKANLSKAGCNGTFFNEADLTRADLSEASCEGAVFHKADLTKAILEGACCEMAQFHGAMLSGTEMVGAKLAGAEMLADFVNDDGLEVVWAKAKWNASQSVKWSNETKWPKGFDIQKSVDRQIYADREKQWVRYNDTLDLLERLDDEQFAALTSPRNELYWLQLADFKRQVTSDIDQRRGQSGIIADSEVGAKKLLLSRIEGALSRFPETSFNKQSEDVGD